MRKGYIFLWLSLLYFLSGCQRERVIEKPIFGVWNNSQLEISKIVLNDTASLFYMYAKKGNLMGMDTSAYLLADGKQYPVKEAQGIILPIFCSRPKTDTTQSAFVLVFKSLPSSVKQVDLFLSKSPQGVQIWDISLDKNAHLDEKMIPEEVRNRKIDIAREWKTPALKEGKTKLEVQVAGYKPQMGKGIMYWTSFLPGQKELAFDENGKVVVEFSQLGALSARVSCYTVSFDVILSPGETAKVYVDLKEQSRRRCSYRENETCKPVVCFEGEYADLNHALANGGMDKPFNTRHSSDFLNKIAGATDLEYVDVCVGEYKDKLSVIRDMKGISEELRHYLILEAQLNCVQNVISMQNQFKMANARDNGNNPKKEADTRPSRKHFERIKLFDLNNYDYMMIAMNNSIANMLFCLKTEDELEKLLKTREGYAFDLMRSKAAGSRLQEGYPLQEEQIVQLATASPVIREAFMNVHAQNAQRWKEHLEKPGYRVCEAPAVADEKLFDAIVASYKGKVLFVDFWATWCNPCMRAMETMHPVKEELKNENIAYVFITGESSPLEKWQKEIPDIGGDHYRLTNKQLKCLNDQLKIKGIPHYVVISKTGEKKYTSTGFMGCDKMREVLKQEI